MKKTFWIVVIFVIVIGFLFWQFREEKSSIEGLPQIPEVSEKDTTTEIQEDLDEINLGDIDKEFESIDADLNNL